MTKNFDDKVEQFAQRLILYTADLPPHMHETILELLTLEVAGAKLGRLDVDRVLFCEEYALNFRKKVLNENSNTSK
jgi:hypothetical protein|tara:strand:+ start:254 stop:481 length:228 start_codon:yes stop_codon:yes gene_type:complete